MNKPSPLDSQADRAAFLKRVSLFVTLDPASLQTLARDFRPKKYQKHDIVFWQYDTSSELYLVRQGKVRVFKTSPSGGETSISIFSEGSIVGELACLDQQPRSATAKAIDACMLWEMNGATFLSHLNSMPELSLAVIRMLADKLRWTAAYAEAIGQFDAAGRLLHILLLYTEQFGEPIVAGKQYTLNLAMSQDDLASLVGVRREWVNRLLQEWRRKGLLEYRAGQLIIHDLPAMQQERNQRLEMYQTESRR